MASKIIISSDELIVCPKDHHKFPLQEGITRQTMEKYEAEFDAEFEKRGKTLKEQVEKDVRKQAAKEFATEKGKLEEQNKTIQENLEQKEGQVKASKEREGKLLAENGKLKDAKADLELESQRKLNEERQKIREEAETREAEKTRFKEAEHKEKLESAQRSIAELTRKLEQGSQQLQGEVLELELEGALRSAFPFDTIEAVKKGAHGADILQRVHNQAGQLCGTIIWEAKRTESWSDKWLQKLKDDQMREGAEIAVIVTTNLPKGSKEPFLMQSDVWIASPLVVRPIAETLRAILIGNSKLKVANTGKGEKMELLYTYLCSPQFAQRIRAVVETFASMKQTLNQERNAMAKIWKKREKDIERVALNMMDMCGELQSISHGSLHQLEEIEQLALPAGDDGIANE